jgi:hypothetical protein
MKAAEFNKLIESIGIKYLSQNGFEFVKGNWFYENDEYKLILVSMGGPHPMLQMKYFTLGLVHNGILNIDNEPIKSHSKDLWSYPINIAPSKLKPFLSSGLNDEIWHYIPKFEDNGLQEYCLDGFYYGGANKNTLADKNASTEEKREALIEDVSFYGIDYIEEEIAIERLEEMFKNLEEFTLLWANSMSRQEVIHQLEHHGQKKPFEITWIDNYKKSITELS